MLWCSKLVGIMLPFIIASANLWAQPGLNMDRIGLGMHDGRLTDLAATGNYLYIGTRQLGPERYLLTVVDMSDASRPRRLSCPYEGEGIEELFLHDTLLFVPTWGPTIVYNVRDPASPTEVNRFDHLLGLRIKEFNGYLVSIYGYSLRFLDVSDLGSPQIAASLNLSYEPYDYDFYEDNVMITNSAGIGRFWRYFEIYDLNDLQNPFRVDSTALTPDIRSLRVQLAGEYAYLYYGLNGLQIYNIGDPASPESIGVALNDYLFSDLARKGGNLYAAPPLHDSLLVVDISEPANPTIEAFKNCSAPTNIILEGDKLHVSSRGGAISDFDIADPSRPEPLGIYVPGAYVRHLVVGDYAYWAETDGFKIIDISDPSTPVAINEYYRLLAGQIAVQINGSLLMFDQYPDVAIFSLDEPRTPTQLGFLPIHAGASDIRVSGNYMFVAYFWRYGGASDNGFLIADISDAANPIEVGSYSHHQQFYDFFTIAVSSPYLYASEENDSLGIYDVSDPTEPLLVRRFRLPMSLTHLSCRDSTLYGISWLSDHFYSLDITNPINPFLLDSMGVINPRNFSFERDISYVVDSIGLEAVDISNPRSLELAGNYPATYARDVFVKNDTIYLATLDSGLWVLCYDRESGIERVDDIPNEFMLRQNYPNPFNSSTAISYSLAASGHATLSIYSIIGQKVATPFSGVQRAGEHKVVWDAEGVPSGVYFARLESAAGSGCVKMVLLR